MPLRCPKAASGRPQRRRRMPAACLTRLRKHGLAALGQKPARSALSCPRASGINGRASVESRRRRDTRSPENPDGDPCPPPPSAREGKARLRPQRAFVGLFSFGLLALSRLCALGALRGAYARPCRKRARIPARFGLNPQPEAKRAVAGVIHQWESIFHRVGSAKTSSRCRKAPPRAGHRLGGSSL